jgi:hypothetical protein
MAFAHSEGGRVQFTVALDDPNDASHVVSFSGINGVRADDNSYEMPVDRMLLNSSRRPRVDGLPIPEHKPSAGTCKQLGNFPARRVSNVFCQARDEKGNSYEVFFESDGSPVSVRRIRRSAANGRNPFN